MNPLQPLPPLRPYNFSNAQGGVTLAPNMGGGPVAMSGSSGSLTGRDAISFMRQQRLAGRGPSAINAMQSMAGGPLLPPMMDPSGHGGGRPASPGASRLPTGPMLPTGGGRHGGGGVTTMGPPRPRIDAKATPAMTTSDWIAQNEAQGGHGLTPSYGSMGALPPRPQSAALSSTLPQPAATTALAPFDPFAGTDKNPDSIFGAKANGGAITRPSIVGENGPELVIPRDNGQPFVLPADVTGRVMESVNQGMQQGAFATMQSPHGSGFASRIGLNPVDLPRGIADERGMINTATMQPMPDILPEGNPWRTTSGIMPRTDAMEQLPQTIADASQRAQQRFDMVPAGQAGTVTVDGRPMLKADALMAMRERGAAHLAQMEGERAARDFASRDARIREDQARRVAAQSALLAPFAGIPGMTPQLAAKATRNVQNFLKTPQGSMWAMQQGMNQQRQPGSQAMMQAATTAFPITDPTTGRVMGYVNGLGQRLSPDSAPDAAVKNLQDIMADSAQPLAQRETARRRLEQLTGQKIMLPKPGGKAPKTIIAPNAGDIMNPNAALQWDEGSQTWKPLQQAPAAAAASATSAPAGGARKPSAFMGTLK